MSDGKILRSWNISFAKSRKERQLISLYATQGDVDAAAAEECSAAVRLSYGYRAITRPGMLGHFLAVEIRAGDSYWRLQGLR